MYGHHHQAFEALPALGRIDAHKDCEWTERGLDARVHRPVRGGDANVLRAHRELTTIDVCSGLARQQAAH